MPPTGQLIGYARVSTEDQDLGMQVAALKAAGCTVIYEEKISGAKNRRRQLDLAIKELREGDTFMVWRLDRLSRSMRDLYQRLGDIEAAGAKFRSVEDKVDFGTANGKFMLGVLASVAEFERQVTAERTKAGIAKIQSDGGKFGAKAKFDRPMQLKAERLLAMKERRSVRGKKLWRKRYSQKQVAAQLGISPQTLYLYLKSKS